MTRQLGDEPKSGPRAEAVEAAGTEAVRARDFWRQQPTNDYYRSFQPQTLLLIDRIARLRAKSVLVASGRTSVGIFIGSSGRFQM